MHRDGADPERIQPEDILCDFCTRAWGEDVAMVEGHRGSCICGDCLTVAWRAVVEGGLDDAPAPLDDPDAPSWICTMCLEARSDPAFQSPVRPEAYICRRCIRLAGRALDLDEDHAWNKPSSGAVADRGGAASSEASDP